MSEKQKLIKLLYLAGYMDYRGEDTAPIKWRQKITKASDKNGIDVINPFLIPKVPAGAKYIKRTACVERDKKYIEWADAVLADFTREDINSIGTSMEVKHAWDNGKMVVAFVGKRENIPLWLEYHCTAVFESPEQALTYIVNHNRRQAAGKEEEMLQFSEEEEDKKGDKK